MVSDPCGEMSGAEEQIEVCEETPEESSPNQSNREMVNPEQTNSNAEESLTDQSLSEERAFVINLYRFMKDRGTPIERIPHLGFKQSFLTFTVNLWKIYKAVETLGGYDSVTARRLWKNVYDELGGSPGSTSAATCTRRHYERLVLPFERHRKGEEDKPLPPSKPRKQYKRSDENKSSKAEGKKRRRTVERDELEETLRADHHCERGLCPHPSSWPMSSEHPESDRLAQGMLPDTCPREKPLLQPLSPALVISPLEKKKRLAQASLNLPAALEEGSEPERPSVIQLSHSSSSQSPARVRHASDGSPLPLSSPSASPSRSSSPYSVSSEEGVVGPPRRQTPAPEVEKQQKPAQFGCLPNTEAGTMRVCKPLSRYPLPKELAGIPRQHYQDFLHVSPAHQDKTQRMLPIWATDAKLGLRHSALRNSVSASPGPSFWVPSASSFTKVLPRRTGSLQPSYKPHHHHHQPNSKRPSSAEAYMKKTPFTDRKDKTKMVVPKPVPPQHYLVHSQASLSVPYLVPAFDRPRIEAVEQLKSVQPFLLPTHLAIPPSQSHPTHHLPVGTSFSGPYEAALRSYPYPLPLWHPPAGFSMASLQPY
uniref:AT rich interactive domain 5A (MRF1-like) n=1 Tax=Astyanax mexicanus TaxID=7994 RepID=A0A8B9GP66_ASTMX